MKEVSPLVLRLALAWPAGMAAAEEEARLQFARGAGCDARGDLHPAMPRPLRARERSFAETPSRLGF